MSWLKQVFKGAGGKARGFFESFQTGATAKKQRLDWQQFNFKEYSERFDNYASKYPKVKSALLSLAGSVAGEGLFTVSAGDYPRALEAKEVCDKFNKQVGMYLKVRQVAYRMTKYGTAFWELDWNNVNGLNVQAVPYQKYMTPLFDSVGNVSGWSFNVHSESKAKWDNNHIAVFALDPEDNPPFGTSLLTGIDYELETQDQIRQNLLKYMEKQAFASNVLQVGDGEYMPNSDEVNSIESKVRNREVGEDFVTSYPTALQVMGAAQIETKMIPETLKFSDDQVTDALMIAPISKLYNSTEASATTMTDAENTRIIYPLQMVIAEIIEKQIYKPMLEDLGFSVNVVPTVTFEPPDIHSNEDAQYYGTLIDKKIMTPEQAAKELGVEYDKAFWAEQEKKEQDKFNMELKAKQQKEPSEEKQPQLKAGESWLVKKVYPNVNGEHEHD